MKRYLLLLQLIETRIVPPVVSILATLSQLPLFVHTQCCMTLDYLIIKFHPRKQAEIRIRQRQRERETEREREAAAVGSRMSFLCIHHFWASSILPCLQKNSTLTLWETGSTFSYWSSEQIHLNMDLVRPLYLRMEMYPVSENLCSPRTPKHKYVHVPNIPFWGKFTIENTSL